MKKVFQLSFLPRSADFALLFLRVWFGLAMLILHGWSKLMNFAAVKGKLPDPLHVGPTGNAALAVLAEVICPVLIVLGLGTRLAALIVAIEMAIAFFMVHGAQLKAGELALVYLGPALVLFFAGGGKFGVDES